MKQLKYIFLNGLVLIIVFSTCGCSDFLEQEPGAQVSINEQLSSKAGVQEALTGIYKDIEGLVRSANFGLYADYQGGNLTFTPSQANSIKGEISTPNQIENTYNFQDQSNNSDFSSFYNNSYDIINQVNLILEFINEVPDASQTEKNQIIAEALSIRGYTHFLLSLIYCQNYDFTNDASHLGIVYNTKTLTNGEINYPSRETLSNTYKFIETDLLEAIELYTPENALGKGPATSYFTEYATKALLARVYLYKNDWDNAFKMANDVISNSGKILTPKSEYISEWKEPNAPLSEMLLEFSPPRDNEDDVSAGMYQYYGYFYDAKENTLQYSRYVSSQDLLNLFEPDDLRIQLFQSFDIETFSGMVNGERDYDDLPYYFTNKYQDNAGYIAFRLSEMYLIRAEAYLNNEKFEEAKNDINTIRSRANASLLENTNNLEDAILLERRKELCFEGHLFFDLRRNHKDIIRNQGCYSTVCNLSYPSPKLILPIPLNNLNLNSNLKQNESY
ncbi:RagB/SusD family nutrient uptake outer membrane protein [Aestuariibaculum sediminum]|nr:RagB/SusD family nutrient uptake outer membrane protein [Aestuariibaculum sediminum]